MTDAAAPAAVAPAVAAVKKATKKAAPKPVKKAAGAKKVKKAAAKKPAAKKPAAKKVTKKAAKKTATKKAAPKKAANGGPTHPAILGRTLLRPMVDCSYYPQGPVADGQALLLELAARIERERPVGEAVYALTHATTEAFNDLQDAFYEAGSEIETVAREAIADDIDFVLKTYGYDVDLEEAISPRDW